MESTEEVASKAPVNDSSASATTGLSSNAGSTSNQKKEAAKPKVDDKKEKLKNALFTGISATQKEDDDSDDEKKKKEEEPAGEVNLLDFDSGPSQPTGAENPPATTGDLLDTGMGSSNVVPSSNNLLDVMDSSMP